MHLDCCTVAMEWHVTVSQHHAVRHSLVVGAIGNCLSLRLLLNMGPIWHPALVRMASCATCKLVWASKMQLATASDNSTECYICLLM